MARIDCIYCGKSRRGSKDHVLPRAFAGPGADWELVDIVCSHCNSKVFTAYERAWTAAPPFADMRCGYGPEGRERDGRAYVFHPAERIFLRIEGDPIAYEADMLRKHRPHYRPQLVDAGPEIISVIGTVEDGERFNARLKEFAASPEVTLQKRSPKEYRVARLDLSDPVRIAGIEWRDKPGIAWWDDFGPAFEGIAHPRLSLDPMGRLRFRTRRLHEIADLFGRALAAKSIASQPNPSEYAAQRIQIDATYRQPLVHRAVAKTLVNYLIDQCGPDYVRMPAFAKIRTYCIGGPDRAQDQPFVQIQDEPIGIALFDTLPVTRHLLLLTSHGDHIVGFVKLYGQVGYRVELGIAPDRRTFEHATLIDYNGPGRVAP